MIEWLWQTMVVQRLDRIAHGHVHTNDVMAILTFAGTCVGVAIWLMRRLGRKAAADQWENSIRETAQEAEREGWHGVREWHRRFGYIPSGSPSRSGKIFIAVALLVFGGLWWWLLATAPAPRNVWPPTLPEKMGGKEDR